MANESQVIISLDYELFFGRNTGSVHNCCIKPIDELVTVLDKYQAKLSLFVDAGFLIALNRQASAYPELAESRESIRLQLKQLIGEGHDVQLHIHSHWEDCHYNGDGWNIVTDRYRLHSFDENEIQRIVRSYKQELESIANSDVFAYRAGGWCLQPFDKLRKAFLDNDIWLDSTVYDNGVSKDPTRWHDFSHVPELPYWRFSSDPVKEDPNGEFLEIPISSIALGPTFYWKMAFTKKFSKHQHKAYGDGQSMIANSGYYLSRLTRTTHSPVSIDGIKANTLSKAFKHHTKNAHRGIFNIMGHPKSLSNYSIRQLDAFLSKTPGLSFITFQDLKNAKPS